MQFGSVLRNVTMAAVAVSMMASPTVAAVSQASVVRSAPVQTISPMVALSIFGSQASAAALCGSSATATAASAAATAQAPAGGCVLPVVDAPPPVAIAEPLPPPPSGFGIAPILLGLAGIAILAALLLDDDDDDDEDDVPVSVN